jgi:hypothetical protein
LKHSYLQNTPISFFETLLFAKHPYFFFQDTTISKRCTPN